jgi:hypothetical protein
MNQGDPVRWKLYAEAVRLWIPIVVSLCAISLTVFQAMTTRRHARLSVQPRIEWRITEDATRGTIELSLANVGFGPGTLRGLAFVIDGQPIPAVDLEACQEVSRRIGRHDEAKWDTRCFANAHDYVLRPGDTATIYASAPVAALADTDHAADLVDYRRFGASATYCSFYEDCWQLPAR